MPVLWITAADLNDPDDPNAPRAAEMASWALFKLSGEKYPGVQEVTEWYGTRGSSCFSCSFGETFVSDAGAVTQPHRHRFHGGATDGLRTRGKPIVSVASIASANGILPSADYKVANRSVIYRTNRAPWNFDSGVTVRYRWGQYPPAMGIAAAIALGNESLLAMNEDSECAFPDRVTSVTKTGLSFTLSDPAALAALRMTGIPDVDLFLSIANPSGALKKPRVLSPDRPRGERYL